MSTGIAAVVIGDVRLLPGNEAAGKLSAAQGRAVAKALHRYFRSAEPARTKLYATAKGFAVSAFDDRWWDWSGAEHSGGSDGAW